MKTNAMHLRSTKQNRDIGNGLSISSMAITFAKYNILNDFADFRYFIH
jgi:hypothetical protein